MAVEMNILEQVLGDAVDAIRFRRPLLVQAAAQGHHEVLRCLLQRLNALAVSAADTPELGEALVAAADAGHALCLSALLESCASPLDVETLVTARGEEGETALILAAGNGNAECISQLLQHHPETQVTAANRHGDNALILASEKGHAECISRLLQHIPQAQVTQANYSGDNALIFAAEKGHAECISRLLQHSPEAQVTQANSQGDNALIFAADKGHAECISHLLQHSPEAQVATAGNDGTALVCAARYGRSPCLGLLLAHSLQEQNLDGALLAALQAWDADLAATSPHTRCLEQLLAEGAQLPADAAAATREKRRRITRDVVSRALVAERASEAIVGLALAARSRTRKAGQQGP